MDACMHAMTMTTTTTMTGEACTHGCMHARDDDDDDARKSGCASKAGERTCRRRVGSGSHRRGSSSGSLVRPRCRSGGGGGDSGGGGGDSGGGGGWSGGGSGAIERVGRICERWPRRAVDQVGVVPHPCGSLILLGTGPRWRGRGGAGSAAGCARARARAGREGWVRVDPPIIRLSKSQAAHRPRPAGSPHGEVRCGGVATVDLRWRCTGLSPSAHEQEPSRQYERGGGVPMTGEARWERRQRPHHRCWDQ